MDVHAFLLAFKLLYEEIKFGGLFVRLFAGNNECKQRFRQYTNLIYIYRHYQNCLQQSGIMVYIYYSFSAADKTVTLYFIFSSVSGKKK